MTTKMFESSENPHIIMRECTGDLTIKGEAGTGIKIRTRDSEEDITIVQEDNTFIINTCVDCRITCPAEAHVTIEQVHGDLRLKTIQGALDIGPVHGDISLKNVGTTTVEKVFGDLHAKQIDGDLCVVAVHGDANITDVMGAVSITEVSSDLKADRIAQNLTVKAVGADAILGPHFTPDTTITLVVGSDLIVRLPEDANMQFTLQASGGVRNTYLDLELIEEQGTLSGTLGAGATILEATVAGRAIIKGEGQGSDYAPDFDVNIDLSFLEHLDDLGPMIESRVSEAMAILDAQLQATLQNIDGDKIRIHIEHAAAKAERAAERVAERARAVAERETVHARRNAERQAERARMRAEHADRRWQRASGRRAPTPPTSPTPPTPPTPAADDMREERLQVLRLVEEGKITPEDAANLLAALR